MNASVSHTNYRSVFISDTHLGTRGCRADFLADFLSRISAQHIYLVGDVIDGWRLKRGWFWDTHHDEVLRLILRHARSGADITYIPGNHDEVMRKLLPLGPELEGIEFAGIRFAYPVPGPLDVLAGDAAAPAGVLDEDLRRAALAALTLDRQACRRHAEQFSWAASTAQFYENLVPLRTGCTATRPHDNSVQAEPAQAGTVSVDGSAASVRTACTASTTASNATESS